MSHPGQVRWGIVSTANIARAVFLPGLRQAGGDAAAVAGRDAGRAAAYAREHQIPRSTEGYQALIDDPGIDALYVAVPNVLHAEWTIRALEAGKPVLCEKPLCGTLRDTEKVLEAARRTGTLLWEAFAFPFHAQITQIRDLIAGGAIGDLREIKSNFHFPVTRPTNIRMSRDLQGGALNDVGCYPVRLAGELFGQQRPGAWARAQWGGEGVDTDTWGVLEYAAGRRLLFSCGFGRSYDTFTALEGTGGQIHMTNPFHPGPADFYQVRTAGKDPYDVPAAPDELSFTAMLRHINAVLRGEQQARLLAVDTALSTAQALHDVTAELRPGQNVA